jgi:hypothetical protein
VKERRRRRKENLKKKREGERKQLKLITKMPVVVEL